MWEAFMKLSKQVKNIIVVLSVVLLIGCVVSKNYETGQEMANAKRWEEAITFFEKALSEEPGNQEYSDALNKAKRESARIIYDKARQSLTQLTEQNLTNIEQIAKSVEKASQLDPKNKDILAFSQSLKDKMRDLQSKLKGLYAQADADMQKEDWPAAAEKLRQINKIFLNYEDTASRLAKVEQEGAKMLYQQGVALGKQEDWKMAVQSFKSAMDINPNYYDVSKLYQDALSRDNANYYMTEADKAARSQNWDRAIMMYEKASEYRPDDMELRNKIESQKAKVGQIYFEDSSKLASQGILYKAITKLEASRAYLPALENDPKFKEFINKLCALLIDRADKYSEKELWGNAYAWLQKAEALNPNYPNLFQKVLDARDNINKRIRKSIAVFNFGSPTNNKDAGNIAANKLIAFLYKNASGDLRIIERENLQSILKEMQLGQTGLVDVKTAQAAKMRGIDTFIMGDVLQYSTNFVDRPSNAQEKVLVDEEDVRNPEFSDWLMMHPTPKKEDLATAPPRTVKKRNYQLLSYKKGSATVTAMIEISYKLIDTTTGENIFTNTIAGKLIKEDKYSEGLTIANIPADPLEIPTEGEVLDELTNAKISEFGQSVLKQYQSLEVKYYNEGQQQEKRRNFELALEKYTDAMFDEKLKGTSTPISQKCQEIIKIITQDK
jgi:tetratricopeptide (TPR) repeat protein